VLQYSVQRCFFEVARVQSEESESCGIQFVAGEFEILDLQLAFSATHSAGLGKN
jgi:hypothetical protein